MVVVSTGGRVPERARFQAVFWARSWLHQSGVVSFSHQYPGGAEHKLLGRAKIVLPLCF